MPTVVHSGFSSENLTFDHKSRCAEQHPDYRLHMHDTLELFFLKKGKVTYLTAHGTYPLMPGSLVISRPFELHTIRIHDFTEYERYVILLDEKQIGAAFYRTLSRDITVVYFGANHLVTDLFQKLDYYRAHLTGEALKTVLCHLTEEIICNAVLFSQNPQYNINSLYKAADSLQATSFLAPSASNTITGNSNPLIWQALEYICANLDAPISIDDICRTLYVTKGHLHRLFTAYLQTSPKQYILSQKLLLANHKLKQGMRPTEVASACGFTNYATFYRDYKKYFGHTPSDQKEEPK